jgi:adenine-specific DNA-methyltransferase
VENLPEVDVAYFDPPYNQHPYGSNYFMLNLLVDYKRPEDVSRVSGIPVDWNRSQYNRRRDAEIALLDLTEKVKAKFVLISYNSDGFIKHDRFTQELAKLGTLSIFETPYNVFRASRNLHGRSTRVTEFLYLVEKY